MSAPPPSISSKVTMARSYPLGKPEEKVIESIRGSFMVTRREVLQAAVTGAASQAMNASPQLAAEPGWFDKPMRWVQLNSTEDDAAEMDIPFGGFMGHRSPLELKG